MKYRLIILLLIAICLNVYGKQSPNSHSAAFKFATGYNRIDNYLKSTPAIGGIGLNFGVAYEYEASKSGFLLQIGADIALRNSQMLYKNWRQTERMFDTEGDEIEMYFDYSNINESQNFIFAGGEFLMGYKNPNGVYFLMGPKVHYALMGSATTRCDVTSSGRYAGLIGGDGDGYFDDMPDHYLKEMHHSLSTTYKPSLHAAFALEVGYSLSDKLLLSNVSDIRIAGFIEGGVLMRGNNSIDDPLTINSLTTGEYAPQMNHYLWTGVTSNMLSTIYGGIKCTILITRQNQGCNCYQDYRSTSYKAPKVHRRQRHWKMHK